MGNAPFDEYNESALKDQSRENASYIRNHPRESQHVSTHADSRPQAGFAVRNLYTNSFSPSFASYFEPHQPERLSRFSSHESQLMQSSAERPLKNTTASTDTTYLPGYASDNPSRWYPADREYANFNSSQPLEPASAPHLAPIYGSDWERDRYNVHLHPYQAYKYDSYIQNSYMPPQSQPKSQYPRHQVSRSPPRKGLRNHSRSQSKLSFTDGVTKSGKKPGAKSHRRRFSSRNVDFESGNISMALTAPTFVPGIPSGSTFVGPQVTQTPPGGFYWALISLGNDCDDPDNESGQFHALSKQGSEENMILPIQMCQPPLCNILPAYPQALDPNPQPRMRKQSKYTAEQDELILELKSQGKGWAEIAKQAHCHNQLAARNRYQVLIGQQGGGTFVWTNEDCAALQDSLDEGERAKWLFIASELSKKLEQPFSVDMVHYKVASLFAEQPETFGVIRTTDSSRGGAPFERTTLYSD